MNPAADNGTGGLEIAARRWSSRLILGTGGFRSLDEMRAALEASGTEIVTVALARLAEEMKGAERNAALDRMRRLPGKR